MSNALQTRLDIEVLTVDGPVLVSGDIGELTPVSALPFFVGPPGPPGPAPDVILVDDVSEIPVPPVAGTIYLVRQ